MTALVAALLALLGVILAGTSMMALRRCRPTRFLVRLLAGLLLLAVGGLLATVGIATYGYVALTREEVAARIAVEPVGPQRFRAVFHFPDGREAAYTLAGDEIYVDAFLGVKPVFLGDEEGQIIEILRHVSSFEGLRSEIVCDKRRARTTQKGNEKFAHVAILRRKKSFDATRASIDLFVSGWLGRTAQS